MRPFLLLVLLLCNFAPVFSAETTTANPPEVHFKTWSDAEFQKARQEKKPVLLDLHAVWCHWCHVMDKETYGNPEVVQLLNDHFITLSVDEDSRPDLANRYQEYGWPATIIFSPDGKEIVKNSGFIPASDMVKLLKNIIQDPYTPSSSIEKASAINYSSVPKLTEAQEHALLKQSLDEYDTKHGGFGTDNKFLDWDTTEYCIMKAKAGDEKFERMAKETLNAEFKLLDPVWGGVYQYSTDGDWVHPHFEKIMQMQAEDIRIYTLAYELWHDKRYLAAAVGIYKFLNNFLKSPEGAFYTSMDADLVPGKHSAEYFQLNDGDRRKRGIPRIDKHIYARENGWAINALMALYGATSNRLYLNEAQLAANWIIANRSLPGGGFMHDSKDKAGPYLDDTMAMGRAFLSLYAATGDKNWLQRAEHAANYIDKYFKCRSEAGFATAALYEGATPMPDPTADENVMLVRFTNLLYQYTGKKQYKEMADFAMRYLATEDVGKDRGMYTLGILLAHSELKSRPAHITVVGHKDDPIAQDLVAAALKYPSGYKMVEWWDRREGSLPNMDIEFPDLPKAAAFACANQRCSRPVYEPQEVFGMVERLSQSQSE
jgi:uncharacterized protein YyaL (SSP411 family)